MKEIGGILGISARTAETHRARIMDKLKIHDIAGLVRYALKHGLIEGLRSEDVSVVSLDVQRDTGRDTPKPVNSNPAEN